ncbi:hypothetical protein F511_11884 [Dorcoceras hygrometricum]|uniref:Uncharacterized protein n=1 Tax=Dorcoceras hygrometricum TaxID=472368 RepID=A0A2Z7DHD1_9LAMI|nr:hypothetical protein F511_11884 [Dorcoceras hygrometricum]
MTKEIFIETFGLPTEGVTSFLDVPKETVVEMRNRFSGSDVPFRAPIEKREMKMEFWLLHDIVAKALCAKAGSFDMVTSEKFDLMVAISAGFKIDLEESVKLHPQEVLTNKSVQTYIKKNLDVKPTGETSKHTKDTASGTEGGQSNITKPMDMQVETQVEKKNKTAASKKNKAEEPAVGKKKKKEKAKKVVKQQLVEAEGQTASVRVDAQLANLWRWDPDPPPPIPTASTKSTFWTSSDEDLCALAGLKERRAKRKQVVESLDSEAEATVSAASVRITTKLRTKRMKQMKLTVDQQDESQPSQISEYKLGKTRCQLMVRHQLVMSLLVVAQKGMREQLLIKKYIILDEQEMSTGRFPEGETFEIADWVGKGDGIDKEETHPRIPALEFSTQDEQEQAAARKATQPDVQIQIVNQLVELVNHLKDTGDAKKGEGGQSRGSEGGQGPNRQGEGPSSTRGKRTKL